MRTVARDLLPLRPRHHWLRLLRDQDAGLAARPAPLALPLLRNAVQLGAGVATDRGVYLPALQTTVEVATVKKARRVALPTLWEEGFRRGDAADFEALCCVIEGRLSETDDYDILLSPVLAGVIYINAVTIHLVTKGKPPITTRHEVSRVVTREVVEDAAVDTVPMIESILIDQLLR